MQNRTRQPSALSSHRLRSHLYPCSCSFLDACRRPGPCSHSAFTGVLTGSGGLGEKHTSIRGDGSALGRLGVHTNGGTTEKACDCCGHSEGLSRSLHELNLSIGWAAHRVHRTLFDDLKEIATDETNPADKWIADQRDESSRIHFACLRPGAGIGYRIILKVIFNIAPYLGVWEGGPSDCTGLGRSVIAALIAAKEAFESNFIAPFSLSIPSWAQSSERFTVTGVSLH